MASEQTRKPHETGAKKARNGNLPEYSAWLEGDEFNVAKSSTPSASLPNSSSVWIRAALSITAAIVLAGAYMLFEPIWHMVGPVEALGQD